jgi:HAMP domain-containing protein
MNTFLTFQTADGSVSVAMDLVQARALQQALDELVQHLKEVAATSGQKKTPHPATEYLDRGEVYFELFCNPNIWPSPYAAKALVTIKSPILKVSTEVELSRFRDDLQEFMSANS